MRNVSGDVRPQEHDVGQSCRLVPERHSQTSRFVILSKPRSPPRFVIQCDERSVPRSVTLSERPVLPQINGVMLSEPDPVLGRRVEAPLFNLRHRGRYRGPSTRRCAPRSG